MEFSKHAMERYVERICGIEEPNAKNAYLSANEELIKERIEKAILYGRLIYTGTINGHKNTNVYCNKQGLIVIVDPKTETIITIYQKDLGLGEDFNISYMERVFDKLDGLETYLLQVEERNSKEIEKIEAEKEYNLDKIKEYSNLIKELEKRNKSLDEYRKTLTSERSITSLEIKDLVESLTRK